MYSYRKLQGTFFQGDVIFEVKLVYSYTVFISNKYINKIFVYIVKLHLNIFNLNIVRLIKIP